MPEDSFDPTDLPQKEEGFGAKSVMGALFIGLVMLPGSLYLSLVAGQGAGPAAQWVTVILFAEITRRSFTTLRKQEIYILFAIAGMLSRLAWGMHQGGGPFAELIWNQYIVRSPEAEGMGLSGALATWIAPHPDSEALVRRTLLHRDWIPAILVLIATHVIFRVNSFAASYALYRYTSGYERLPYPMAKVSAAGAMALAESAGKSESWRWRIFSMGAIIGLGFGIIYVGIPTLTGATLSKSLAILPIPWIDLTLATERVLPAAPTGLATDLGLVLTGFILPFEIVVGQGIASLVLTLIVSPMLYKMGAMRRWRPGMSTIPTSISARFDVWLSAGIGLSLVIFVLGVVTTIFSAAKLRKEKEKPLVMSSKRGFRTALLVWVIFTLAAIYLCHILVPGFPVWLFVLYGFFFTPINSYVAARLTGMAGRSATFPYVREATFILSGYKGPDIWWAPIPLDNYGPGTQAFRELELTGTKITSLVKAQVLVFPILFGCSFLFWNFFWRLSEIPSSAYPWAAVHWPQEATFRCLWATANQRSDAWMLEAIRPNFIAASFATGMLAFGVIRLLGLGSMWFYGLAAGVGALPHDCLPRLVGALLSRFYFSRKIGRETWRNYAPVLLAGYSCGMGLIGVFCVAVALISTAVTHLPF